MSVAPPPTPSALREMRATASRQARTLGAGLAGLLAVGLALALVAAFTALDYRFAQGPKILAKILLGVLGVSAFLIWQRLGLFLMPLVIPYLAWSPKLPIPGVNTVNLLVFLIFVPWALSRTLQHQRVFRSGQLAAPFAFLISAAVFSILKSTAVSPMPGPFPTGWASLELFRSATTLALYFITLAMVHGERDRRLLSWSVVAGLACESVTTLILGRNGSGDRALGSFGQSNDLGAFLAVFTVFIAALLPAVRGWLARGALLVVLVLGSLAILFTVSRAAIVAAGLGMLVVAWRSSRVMLFVVVAALATSPFWLPGDVKERMAATQVVSEDSEEVTFERSAQSRIETWRTAMVIVTEHPLDGVGFAAISAVLPYKGKELGYRLVARSTHNTYLRVLAELGVFGLLLFVWLLWRCLRLSLQGVRVAASRFDRQLAVGLGGATVALAASCFFGDRFFSMTITGSFWVVCALVDDLVHGRREARA